MSVIPLFLISLLLPMGFLARRITRPVLSNVLTWLGLLCMGLGSSLFVFALLREVALLATQGFYGLWPLASPVAPLVGFRTDTALLVPVMGLLVTLWGFSNARRTAAVVSVDVPIANLPAALQGFRIVQISDIHLGPTIWPCRQVLIYNSRATPMVGNSGHGTTLSSGNSLSRRGCTGCSHCGFTPAGEQGIGDPRSVSVHPRRSPC